MKQTTLHTARGLRTQTATLLQLMLAAVLTASCSMMSEDRSECPDCRNPLHVVLRYDYNMQHANMFHDQVQNVTCYLTDANTNRIVDVQQAANTPADQPLKNTSFAFNFEGLEEGLYRLYAVASAPASPGPQQYATEPAVGDDIAALSILFPREANANSEGRHDTSAERLDTLWHAAGKPVYLNKREPAIDTLSLVRDTKNLSVLLMQTVNPTDCRADLYDVRILDDNGRFDHLNQPLADEPLTYHPYAAWTTETEADGSIIARHAHYDISFPRLIAHDDAKENARLQVTSRQDGRRIVDVDLTYYLALARNASARNYPIQEFLDREHDYSLDILLDGNEWRYMTLTISVMKWSLRIYNEQL